jgi:menaquinone-9 beta-reductase
MNTIKTKIAIVGAGPTGATLSLLLAKNKIPHLLLDKETFPRDKICGDGYTAEVFKVLREIDNSLYEEFISAPWTEAAHGSYLELHEGTSVGTNFKNLFKQGACTM